MSDATSKDDELRQEVRQHFVTAWQDGYGCAKYPKYKERTDMHTDMVMRLFKQYGVEQRIDETSRSFHRGYFIPEMEIIAEGRIAELTAFKTKQEVAN